VDFPVFNVQVPLNENRSHRLNTTLRTVLEKAGDQPARAANDKAAVRNGPDVTTDYWHHVPPLRMQMTALRIKYGVPRIHQNSNCEVKSF
jgi:hypothetical protein